MSAANLDFPPTDAQLHTLQNGLEIIVKEDRSAPVVSVQIWCRTGSIHEEQFIGAGVSHLVEHMVFKGAGERTPTEIAREVQDTGGYINAYTSFDRTVYWVDAPVDGFEKSLDVLGDLVTGATFPEEEFIKELDVIRREIDMGKDDPGRASSDLLFRTVFKEHPYREPVIGHLDVFNQISHADVLGYYQRHYVPNNMFVVVAGDLDAADVIAAVEKKLGDVPRSAYEPVFVPSEPQQLGRRDEHEEFPTQLTKLCLGWRIPSVTHPDMPALDVLANVLGRGRSSRMMAEIREKQRIVHSIGAFSYTPAHGGVFAVSAELDPEKLAEVEAAILEVIDAVKTNGVEQSEIDKARRMTLGDQFGTLTSMRGQASDLGGNWMTARNLDFTREYIAAINAVTVDDVQRVVREYLIDQTLSVTSLNPTGSLAAKEAPAVVSGTAGIEKVSLPNGLTLLIKEERRVPVVALHATLRGGLLAEGSGNNGVSQLMSRALVKGTQKRSAAEISQVLEEAGGSIGAASGGSSFALSAEVLRPDFDLGLDVFTDVFFDPTFPEDEIALEKDAQIAAIKGEEDQLVTVAFKRLRKELFGEHPFSMMTNGSEESVASLTRDAVADFHKGSVVAGNAVVAIFGDVDTSEVTAKAEQAFAKMAPGERLVSPENSGSSLTESIECDIETEKRQAVLTVAFPSTDLLGSDRLPLDIIDEACSDMASRLFVRIREDLGLAYYVGSTQILGMAPGAFGFYLGTSPEQLGKAEAELLDEIDRLGSEGLSDDELERAKKTWIGKQIIQNQSSGAIARLSALDELYGIGFEHHREVVAQIRAITAEQIRDVAQRYFADKPRVIVRVIGK